ncbi:Protein of unknown function [Cotesia congregata]|uniref:Uncharacterized protein n=1 Tax=Cotesia congregata TaxID=51543 RepID=A0A8J2HMT4_COTCN|nr:Protein of unknown function [Cotesia congregata]
MPNGSFAVKEFCVTKITNGYQFNGVNECDYHLFKPPMMITSASVIKQNWTIMHVVISWDVDYYGQLTTIDKKIINSISQSNTDLLVATTKGSRHKVNKTIDLEHPQSTRTLKYSMAIPKCDREDFHRLNIQKYWWLNGATYMDKLNSRMKSGYKMKQQDRQRKNLLPTRFEVPN